MEIVFAEGNYVFDKGNYNSGFDLLSTGHYDGGILGRNPGEESWGQGILGSGLPFCHSQGNSRKVNLTP
jgi:hypothetical protein